MNPDLLSENSSLIDAVDKIIEEISEEENKDDPIHIFRGIELIYEIYELSKNLSNINFSRIFFSIDDNYQNNKDNIKIKEKLINVISNLNAASMILLQTNRPDIYEYYEGWKKVNEV